MRLVKQKMFETKIYNFIYVFSACWLRSELFSSLPFSVLRVYCRGVNGGERLWRGVSSSAQAPYRSLPRKRASSLISLLLLSASVLARLTCSVASALTTARCRCRTAAGTLSRSVPVAARRTDPCGLRFARLCMRLVKQKLFETEIYNFVCVFRPAGGLRSELFSSPSFSVL